MPLTLQLHPISSAPIGKPILLFWIGPNHFEDGVMFDDGADPAKPRYHVLFDGESMHNEPTHWTDLPDFEFPDNPYIS